MQKNLTLVTIVVFLIAVTCGGSALLVKYGLDHLRDSSAAFEATRQAHLQGIAGRLGVDANWDAIAVELDCRLVQPGMTQEEVEAQLQLVGDFSVRSSHSMMGSGKSVIYAFLDRDTAAALSDRLCTFQDGLLVGIYYGSQSDWFRTLCDS